MEVVKNVDIFEYRDACDSWRTVVNTNITDLQYVLKDIQLLEDLYRLDEFGAGFKDDLAWLHEVWLNATDYSIDTYDDIMERVADIENRLVSLPFEKAYCYREPEFHTKSNGDIVRNVFGNDVMWRFNPSVVKYMSFEDRERIFTHFEYMFYFIINVRDELAFDISSSLDCSICG